MTEILSVRECTCARYTRGKRSIELSGFDLSFAPLNSRGAVHRGTKESHPNRNLFFRQKSDRGRRKVPKDLRIDARRARIEGDRRAEDRRWRFRCERSTSMLVADYLAGHQITADYLGVGMSQQRQMRDRQQQQQEAQFRLPVFARRPCDDSSAHNYPRSLPARTVRRSDGTL